MHIYPMSCGLNQLNCTLRNNIHLRGFSKKHCSSKASAHSKLATTVWKQYKWLFWIPLLGWVTVWLWFPLCIKLQLWSEAKIFHSKDHFSVAFSALREEYTRHRVVKQGGKIPFDVHFLFLHLIWWKLGPVQSTLVTTIIILQFIHIKTWC